MSELKPCPFCGETVSLDYSELPNKKHWYITCDCCGMMYQAVVCQRKDTKTGWNTRPIEDELRKRIAELEAAQRWIPVSERLPEVGEMVLIAYKISRKTYIARARMNKEGMFRFTKNTKPVTHWMPLPSAPESEDK